MFRFQKGKISFRIYAAASALLLIVILLIATAGRGGADTTSNAKVFKMGEEVQSANFSIKINSVKERKEISGRKTSDNFYMVSVTLKNTSNEAKKINSDMFRLVSKSGKRNAADEELSLLANNGGFVNKQLNPGLSATGYIVFEVVKEEDKGAYILEAYEEQSMGDKLSIRVEN